MLVWNLLWVARCLLLIAIWCLFVACCVMSIVCSLRSAVYCMFFVGCGSLLVRCFVVRVSCFGFVVCRVGIWCLLFCFV